MDSAGFAGGRRQTAGWARAQRHLGQPEAGSGTLTAAHSDAAVERHETPRVSVDTGAGRKGQDRMAI